MSMEIYAFSDRRLDSMAAWQAAINAEEFDLVLDQQRPFEQLRGYLPAHRGERLAGFECDHFDPSEIIEDSPDIDFGRRWAHVLAFRFGGDFFELWGAYAAAAAYARATGGIVFDGESGDILTPEAAVSMARDLERHLTEA